LSIVISAFDGLSFKATKNVTATAYNKAKAIKKSSFVYDVNYV